MHPISGSARRGTVSIWPVALHNQAKIFPEFLAEEALGPGWEQMAGWGHQKDPRGMPALCRLTCTCLPASLGCLLGLYQDTQHMLFLS
jgi:hypothetical protein